MTKPLSYDAAKRNAMETSAAFEALANALAERPEFASIAMRARQRARELAAGKFTIMVVGQFNRGKSTLLNAMLGKRLLSSKLTPCTAVVSYLRYGEPRVEVFFNDGRTPNPDVLSHEDFNRKYTLNIEDARLSGAGADAAAREQARDRFSHVDYSVIYDTAPIFRDGVEFVDTPGLEDHDARTARVLNNLNHADAIIMVLDAVTVCDQRESDFIDTRLRPLGLHRNIFFLINRWNLVIQSVIDPNDPREVEETLAEQMRFINTRLAPFAAMAGAGKAAQRIFKVNALGALQLRLRGVGEGPELEATEIPAFERALQDFLTHDRLTARMDRDATIVNTIESEVGRTLEALIHKAKAPIASFEAEHARLDAQLEQLRRIKVNIETLFRAHAAETADKLSQSLEGYIRQEVFDRLEERVAEFDLGELNYIKTQYKIALLDWTRDQEDRVSTRVSRHIQGQVTGMLVRAFNGWREGYLDLQLKERAVDLNRRLQYEAGEYVKVLAEIRGAGAASGEVSKEEIERKIKEWIAGYNPSALAIYGGAALDVAPLLAGLFAAEIANLIALKILLPNLVLPGIGLIVSAIVILIRREFIADNVRKEIVKGLKDKEKEILLDQKLRARESIEAAFNRIAEPISKSIGSEIAVISSSMTDVLERRRDAGFSAEAFERKARAFEAEVGKRARAVRALVS